MGERQSLCIRYALTYSALLMASISFFRSSFKCQLVEVVQGLAMFVGMSLTVAVYLCMQAHLQRSKGNSWESVLSLHHVDLEDKTQVVRLGST